MVRSSETTENGDVDADALLKKESPIPTCSGDGAACAVWIVVLSAAVITPPQYFSKVGLRWARTHTPVETAQDPAMRGDGH